ncbi:hypothetical protein BXY66_1534 [Shimia isoporae]|uniref:Alpha/beta hydrolase n=1 Tax=Shimia isoporae TaxID=647720 RepID=A0A4R1NMS6_9RHOB|nr:hypothetical protein [Shimia isoporae]TCL09485.1 hypothetical protein BXY66_1534 [Shimia isoporae]
MPETSFPHAGTSLIAAETRHAVLTHPTNSVTVAGTPVVVVMPLTSHSQPRAFADETRTYAALHAAGHQVLTVSWRQFWTQSGKERFAPRVKDLDALVTALGSSGQSLHLAAIGNGALVAMKWLAALVDLGGDPIHSVQSLTLIAPELHIFDRQPRTPLRGTPANSCLIADASQDWHSSRAIATKLPGTTQFALAEGHQRFSISDLGSRNSRADSDAATFEGDWRLSWADWLHRARVAELA